MRLIDADTLIKVLEDFKEWETTDGYPIHTMSETQRIDKCIELIKEQLIVEIPSFNLLQDGTLVISTDLYPKVRRVFVERKGSMCTFVGTYYSDGDERPKGEWLRMSNLSEEEDDRYKCSHCGNVVHYKNKMNLYTFNNWCGRCGSDNRIKYNTILESEVEE